TSAGLDPTIVLGAFAPQLGGWARWGTGPHRVVEAVEAPTGWAPTAPRMAVLLGLAADPERAPAAREDALRRFAASVPPEGYIVGRAGDARVRRAVRGIAAAVE